MEKEKIVLFGASQHTKYTIDIIEKEDKYNIIGIIDLLLAKGVNYEGYPVLGKQKDLASILELLNINKGIVLIGDNFMRHKVIDIILSQLPNFKFISAIHPSVLLGNNVKVGDGSVIMAGVIINNDTSIGQHCFLATNSSVDHDSFIGDFSSISAGVTVGGGCTIGSSTAIALGVSIIHGITIGNNTVIGAGALVVKDFESNVVAYGNPAKIIRSRLNGEGYL